MLASFVIQVSLLLAIGSASAQVHVPVEQILKPENQPGNWLTYGGNYAGHRSSSLAQITRSNVAGLKPIWIYQSREAGTKWETTPLVVDGVLYLTERPNIVTALDGFTGRPMWNYRRPLRDEAAGCCGPVNRGLAVLGDSLYLCTFDAHLVCLNANNGKERWDVVVTDQPGYTLTLAPLVVKDKIIVGVSGGEFGVRGFLDAYNAKTGERAWRFWTIPAAGEPGNESWGSGDSWKRGGGTTWVTGTYDPELNLIYWGTGNPSPDYNGDARPGDNLYTDCVIALDANTGKLRWHFQFTPHDVHDWDTCQVPVLIDAEVAGKPRKLVVVANRNAFFYALDRVTGEFITGKPFAKQTWASGLDSRGRPVLLPGKEPSAEGTLVYPGLEGASNWQSPSYSPRTGLFYFQAVEDYGQAYFKSKVDYNSIGHFEGGDARNVLGAEPYGVVKAIEPVTGKVRWEFNEQMYSYAGVLTTAGGLLFSGTKDGYCFALDEATGQPLWKLQTGGPVYSAPVTFLVNGKQYVALAAGQAFFVFGL